MASWMRSALVPIVSFFFSSRRRHTRWTGDWSSDVCSSDLPDPQPCTTDLRLCRARADPRRDRSEERRVGKECRSRWAWDHSKKKPRLDVRWQHLDGDLGAHHRAAEVKQHQHPIAGVRPEDGVVDAIGVGADCLVFFFKQKTAYEMDG